VPTAKIEAAVTIRVRLFMVSLRFVQAIAPAYRHSGPSRRTLRRRPEIFGNAAGGGISTAL